MLQYDIIRKEDHPSRNEMFVQLEITDESGVYSYAKWIMGSKYEQYANQGKTEEAFETIIQSLSAGIASFRNRQLTEEANLNNSINNN